jgi:integrase
MLTIRKRGKSFHVDFLTRGARLRGSLGTRNQDAARRLVHRLGIALSEGADSNLWRELKQVLPPLTFGRFAETVGVKEKRLPTWNELRELFTAEQNKQIRRGKLSQTTADRYTVTIREFESYLTEQNISLLEDINKRLVEAFKLWRFERIKKRKQSRGGTGLVLDIAIMHRVFTIAVESELVHKNPVRMEGRPGGNPQNGAEPFTGAELLRMREHAGDDLLIFLLLRWTGFRGSDATSLTWSEISFDSKEIDKVTQKRGKRVTLPIQRELLFALEGEYRRRMPRAIEQVILNPLTGNPLTRPRLYQRMLALGKRASVESAHPHRFRDTLAVDMLLRGATPYDVAKTLGDTMQTIERCYAPFVSELRERVRSVLERPGGLESPVIPSSQSSYPLQ